MRRAWSGLCGGLILVAVACRASTPVVASQPLPASPPPDRPIATSGDADSRRLEELLAPCRQRALATYPQARARFLAGLPPAHLFAITTRLVDAQARSEQVFVIVDSIRADSVVGRLASDIHLVAGYRRGQAMRVAESAVIDWTIVRPDGSEEGNLMGQVVDALYDSRPDPGKPCRGAA